MLHNAVLLAGGAPEELVFRKALERCSTDGAAPATSPLGGPADAPTLDVAALRSATPGWRSSSRRTTPSTSSSCTRAAPPPGLWPSCWSTATSTASPRWLASRADLGKGTGWMLAPRLLITNHHVINAIRSASQRRQPQDFDLQGKSVEVLFDFHHASSKPTETTSVACVASDPTLDFALLRLPDGADRPPLRSGAPITKPQDRALQERVNVLQHPNGDPMRLGFRNNFVVAGTDAKLSISPTPPAGLGVADLRRRLVRGRAPPGVADHLRRPGDGLGPADQPGELRHPGRDDPAAPGRQPPESTIRVDAGQAALPRRGSDEAEVTWPTGTRAGPPAGSTG